MKPFSCLDPSSPLLGPHLLEASAGTGKTFAIEHIFIRLLLEKSLSSLRLEEILIMTFTKAATRELRHRIRSNLEESLQALKGKRTSFPLYLTPHIGSKIRILRLEETLSLFDQAQIFTIHGFCSRMLKEFAFEASLLSSPQAETEPSLSISKEINRFFDEKLSRIIAPEQLYLLMKSVSSKEEMAQKLLRMAKGENPAFPELFSLYLKKSEEGKKDLPSLQTLKEEFLLIEKEYKSQIKGDFLEEIEWLFASIGSSDPIFFRKLIAAKGMLGEFLSDKNRKARSTKNLPPFFAWAQKELFPLIHQGSSLSLIWKSIFHGWQTWEKENPFLFPDQILIEMEKQIEKKEFRDKVSKKFNVVIVDEFQDTDPVQWKIFETLFPKEKLFALYLVGDPKQSIYRFRSADIYTYLQAKESLLEEHLYRLDTNFRSSKPLIETLNALFTREWLSLPQKNKTLPYFPSKPGREETPPHRDGKGALHWIVCEEGSSFEKTLLPYAIAEIESLSFSSFSDIAFLLKDRYEIEAAKKALFARGIPLKAKSRDPLGKDPLFGSIREVFNALLFPEERERALLVKLGPFGKEKIFWKEWRDKVEKEGLVPFCTTFFQNYLQDFSIRQILEIFFSWQSKCGFSLEGLERLLIQMGSEEGDLQTHLPLPLLSEEGVELITLHSAKGLEFSIVFALGLASFSTKEEEEIEEKQAEKLRQLYVAMTRAKERLYVPTSFSKKESPISLFQQTIEKTEGPFLPFLESLRAKGLSCSIEQIPPVFPLAEKPLSKTAQTSVIEKKKRPLPPTNPSYLSSFSSLKPPHTAESLAPLPERALPKGAQTGVVIHHLLEKIFSSSSPLWKEKKPLFFFIQQELFHSFLADWTQEIQEMIWKALTTPFGAQGKQITLQQIEPENLAVEMEFMYEKPPHFVKGFIDLLFTIGEDLYCIDWKTNVLKEESPEGALQAMEEGDYFSQSKIYEEAIETYLKTSFWKKTFQGVFFLFLRSTQFIHGSPL